MTPHCVCTSVELFLRERPMRPIISIAVGRSMRTKSVSCQLMKNIIDCYADQVTVLSHDNYYRRRDELTYEQRCLLNYDAPAALETDLMAAHLEQLRNGKAIDCPVYDFTQHNRSDETVRIVPKPVIIVEGILIFENKELRDLMDIKVFVDTDADLRLARRILRDVCERGRTMQSVIDQYTTTVKPMHEQFVEPSKRHADVIIPEGGFNSVAVGMLIKNIRSLIDER